MTDLSDTAMMIRKMNSIGVGFAEITSSFATLSAAIKMTGRQINRFGFTVWLIQQPRWLRPLMKFAYWIEGKVGLH